MDYKNLQKKVYKDDTLSTLVDYLKNLNITLPPHEFINFETYEQIPIFRKKISNTEDCAKYNTLTGKIEIYNEVIKPKFINDSTKFHDRSFHKILFNSLKDTDFLTLIFIHEMGHYIQHQDFKLKNKLLNHPQTLDINNFIFKTLSYNTPEEYCKLFSNTESQLDSKSRKDNNEHIHRIITEGFADCFAFIVFNQTNKNKQYSFKILEKYLNARKQARESNTEYYFTDSILTNVLSDLKQDKKFDSLLDIKNYINQQIEIYVPKFIEERLKKNDEVSHIMNQRYLGYISKRLQVNTINDLYQSLSSIGISNNVLFKDNLPKFDFKSTDFQLGIKIAEKFLKEINLPSFSQSVLPEKTTSIKNISSLRKHFTVNSTNNPTKTI